MSKTNRKLITFAAAVLLVGIFATNSWVVSRRGTPPAKIPPGVTPSVLGSETAKCHAIQVIPEDREAVLPDTKCTPGSIDLTVTQENIFQTICMSGYTKTVRPSATYTNKLKTQQIQDYGYSDMNLKDYEEDHLISLELGGNPDDPKNLWPEPGSSPNEKDSIENTCHKRVCAGEITLAEAQKQIATDWRNACQ